MKKLHIYLITDFSNNFEDEVQSDYPTILTFIHNSFWVVSHRTVI